METEYCHTVKNLTKANWQHSEARKSQLVCSSLRAFNANVYSNWSKIECRGNYKRSDFGFVPKPRSSSPRMNLQSSLVNLRDICQEQAFSQEFRSSASGRMRPTARKAFLVSGTRRAEVSKMKNNGEEKVS